MAFPAQFVSESRLFFEPSDLQPINRNSDVSLWVDGGRETIPQDGVDTSLTCPLRPA